VPYTHIIVERRVLGNSLQEWHILEYKWNMKLYEKLIVEMQEMHKELFTKFDAMHARYLKDPVSHQEEFNKIGAEVMDIIRQYERKLVGSTERGGYGKFSTNLSDKLWGAIRKIYPKIDFVGVK
jgi:hypothetical protein